MSQSPPPEPSAVEQVIAELQDSLRSRLLFGRHDEPIDDGGLRLLRVVHQRLLAVVSSSVPNDQKA